MSEFFGVTLFVYLVFAAVIVPVVGVSAWFVTRDCRILSGEDCVWIVVPVSEAPADQRPDTGEE